MRKTILTGFLIIFTALIFTPKVSADAVISKDISRTYLVGTESVDVTEVRSIVVNQSQWYVDGNSEETFTVFNSSNFYTSDSLEFQDTIKTITITDSDGRTLSYTTEFTENFDIIVKTYSARSIYKDTPYSLTLKYSTKLLMFKTGILRDIFVPGLSKNFSFSSENINLTFNAKVVIPKSLGQINFILPNKIVSENAENFEINFSGNDLIGKTPRIQIGRKQFYRFEIDQPFKATTSLIIPYNTFKIVIPRDIESGQITQKVFFTEMNPLPYAIENDRDSNLIAVFKVPASVDGSIKIKGYAVLENNGNSNFGISGSKSEIPSRLIPDYISDATYWEVSSKEIQDTASTISQSTDVYAISKSVYEFIVSQIDYSDIKRFGLNERQGALKTLLGGAAVCMEYSDLYIALVRALGVPARAAFGFAYSPADKSTFENPTINHQWAEVYMPAMQKWLPVDPTWGENGNEIIGGDLNHFYSHVASASPEVPSPVEISYFGNSDSIPDKLYKVEPTDTIPSEYIYSANNIAVKFPQKTTEQESIDNALMSVGAVFQWVNKTLDTLIIQVFGSSAPVNFIKLMIVIIPAVLLIIIYTLKVFRHRRENLIR